MKIPMHYKAFQGGEKAPQEWNKQGKNEKHKVVPLEFRIKHHLIKEKEGGMQVFGGKKFFGDE